MSVTTPLSSSTLEFFAGVAGLFVLQWALLVIQAIVITERAWMELVDGQPKAMSIAQVLSTTCLRCPNVFGRSNFTLSSDSGIRHTAYSNTNVDPPQRQTRPGPSLATTSCVLDVGCHNSRGYCSRSCFFGRWSRAVSFGLRPRGNLNNTLVPAWLICHLDFRRSVCL